MRQIYKSKLTRRIMLKTIIFVTFGFLLTFWITTQVLNKSVEQEITYRDNLIAKTLGSHLESIMNRIVDDIRVASDIALSDTPKARQHYLSQIEKGVAYNPLYLFVVVYDQQGGISASIPEMTYYQSIRLEEIQTRLAWSKTRFISNMMTLPNDQKTIAVNYPSLNEKGDYVGGVTAFLNLSVLSNYLQKYMIGQEGLNMIIDGEGRVVGDIDESKIGASLREHPLYQLIYKQNYGMWQGDLDDRQMVVAYRPLAMNGYGLIVGESREQSLAPAHKVTMLLVQFFILVLAISVILVFYGTSSVLKPIIKLTKQAKEYKENRRTIFDPLYTKDELQDLSKIMGQMAKELTEKERRLFYILESIPYCIITIDNNGLITTFNKFAEELTLFKREEVIGKPIIDVPFKDPAEFFSWKSLQEGTEFVEVESYIYDKNKLRHMVKLYSSPFRGEDDRLIGAILVIRDVSEIKKLEDYLRQSERLAALGQLTAGVAHEIKNPLSIIQAAAEAIQLELRSPETSKHILEDLSIDILETSDRVTRLLVDFLNLAKEKEEEEWLPVDMVQVMNELIHLLRSKMNSQKIRIECLYEVSEAFITGMKNQLIQAFLNLLLNSMQAMEHGGGLTVLIKSLQNVWEIEIRDTGIGISTSKLERIFNPFYSTKREGTGLGLSITHDIIIRHQGTIWAVSTENEGTSLVVQLPKP